MFAEFTELEYRGNLVVGHLGRFEELDDQIMEFLYGVNYYIYYDINNREMIRSKIEIKHSHLRLRRIMYLKFSFINDEHYIIKDFRNEADWV